MLFLLTLAIPWAPSPAWASAGISLSILAVAAFSVNMYTLPLDVFGAAPAGFAIAALVSSYGLISAVIAPIVGTVIDHHGYTPVIAVVVVHSADGLRGALVHEVHAMKQWIFRLLGKGPEAVVVTFCTGDPELCRRMAEEVRSLVPDRRHFVATEENWPELRRELKPYRIGLAPVTAHRANPARCGARPTGWPRTRFWPTTRAWSAIICASIWPRCSSGAACRWTASTCARGGGRGRSASAPSFPPAIA